MSDIESGGGGGAHKGKKKGKKMSTRVDFTPMVDLGFLLITFFMLTTSMNKPQTMEINMPVKDKNLTEDQQTKVKASQTLTVLLTKENKVVYYFVDEKTGEPGPTTVTDYGKDGIRKVLLQENKIRNASVDSIGIYKGQLQTNKITEEDFKGVIDLIKMKAINWSEEDQGMTFTYEEIPAHLAAKAAEMHEYLVEAAAEASEELMDKYLEEGELSETEIKQALRQRTINNEIVLATCGSAFKNKGVQAVLDAVVDFLPAPIDVPAIKGIDENDEEVERPSDDNAPFAALAFKIATDPFVGTLTFIRVYSGVLQTGAAVYNSVKQKRERIGRMVQMHANDRTELKEVRAGDIAAAIGLKEVTTGDTLCDNDHKVILERMEFPEPVITIAVEPRSKADQDKMAIALQKLAAEDPSFKVETDQDSAQTLISGMGELHLDIIVDRMRREFKVEANVGAPQVAYREYLAREVDVDYTHKKQSGGSGQFGRIKFTVKPGERGTGIIFKDEVKGGNIPKEYIPSVEKGMRETAESGSLIGFPIIDFEITLYDGAYHDVDSSALAFEIAGRAGMREAAQKAGIKLLEPIMKVEVVSPEEYLGDVIGDMNSRRGQIQGTDSRGNAQVVESMVPLANMFGYVNQLRSFTQGRANYSMFFNHYDEVPSNVAAEIKEKLA